MNAYTKFGALLLALFISSGLYASTFFRTYYFDYDQGSFNRALELSSDAIALLRGDWEGPFIEGVMLINGSGDSLLFSEGPASPISCTNDLNQFVLAWWAGSDGILLTWVDVFGSVVSTVNVPIEFTDDFAVEDINATADGGYCFAGDNFAVKVDQFGSKEWEYPDEYNACYFYCIAEGADGSFLVGGSLCPSMCQKLSADGQLIWEWSTDDNEMRPIAAVSTPDSGFVLGSPYGDIYKLSSDGDSLWHYESNYVIWYRSIITSGEQIIACGSANMTSLSVLTKLDSDGNLIWEREYPDCGLMSVVEAMDGGYILTGYYPHPYELGQDNASLVIKTDSEGWWGGTGTEPEHYVRDIDITVYPNPSSSFSIVSFTLDYSSMVNLSVFDAAGRLVMEYPDIQCIAGENEITVEGFGSGVYFCSINSGNFTATQRFVVIE